MSIFTMPAEWEEHEATWLAWPHNRDTFPVNFDNVTASFVEIVKALHVNERVNILVLDDRMKDYAMSLLAEAKINMGNINFYIADYADVWTRDYAPLFVMDMENNRQTMVKWIYNSYGNKFPELVKDNDVFFSLKDAIGIPMIEPGIVMEGGSLEVNGKGTLITTEQCLLNPNRNPDLTREKIEEYLIQYVGANHIIWLKDGIVNDHTDGHIDDIVKFTDERTILCAYEDDTSDPNFKILDDNYKILEQSTDQDGVPFKLIKIPMPHMNYNDGEKAPASYLNFYIANGIVLVPIFKDLNDEKALNIIQSLFIDRKVIGIDCSDIIYGGGTIHCMTQQQPYF